MLQPDPAGGQRVVGIVSTGRWALAGVKPGDPISVLSRLGRVIDRDADTYVYMVTGHMVRVVTDGARIRSVMAKISA